ARVAAQVEPILPPALLGLLPHAWERLGRVLILPLPPELEPWRAEVCAAYARILGCEAVLREAGPVQGPLREPVRELLWGQGTETVHVEGGVRYAMDAARVMWSSGNVNERQRIAPLVRPGERVLDLFAGIGYFTLPVAVKARAERVVACEANPVAFGWLQRNLALNKVQARVEARLGDCREVAPRGWADRVLLGYTVRTEAFLPVALAALRPEGGVLHHHEACPAHLWEQEPWQHVQDAARAAGREAKLLRQHIVKNYAPGKVHVVVDAEVR
ncbi:MAG: class I SAM-dependent methyltransferase family protein, partial [Halobacteriales archaeon]|nr:class I SAM-dependent methyltransferase family protein [Halobacteriales archaeon]